MCLVVYIFPEPEKIAHFMCTTNTFRECGLPRPGYNNPVENFTTLQEKCEGDLHLPFYVSASDAYKNEFCALC
ncbi:hypothetical protein MAR_003293, partial [Mya arenaria]